MLNVKILSYKTPQRYAVRQALMAARNELRKTHPDFDITISEVKTLEEIEQYTLVLVGPSLVINDKVFCSGWFPKKEEIIGWFRQFMDEDHPGNQD
jgi:hypothetical protein